MDSHLNGNVQNMSKSVAHTQTRNPNKRKEKKYQINRWQQSNSDSSECSRYPFRVIISCLARTISHNPNHIVYRTSERKEKKIYKERRKHTTERKYILYTNIHNCIRFNVSNLFVIAVSQVYFVVFFFCSVLLR